LGKNEAKKEAKGKEGEAGFFQEKNN